MTSFTIGADSTTQRTLADGEFGVILPSGTLRTDDTAIESSGDVSVSVFGLLASTEESALSHSGGGYLTLVVGDDGFVQSGDGDAVAAGGLDGATVTNLGTIKSAEDALDLRGVGDIWTTNHGRLSGRSDGLVTSSDSGASMIVNTGLIRGLEGGGIDVVDGASAVINRGTIEGAEYGISGGDGRDQVYNFGTIKGGVYLLADEDRVANRGTVDLVDLGGGDDVYVGQGLGQAGVVFGGGGRDYLIGSRADDVFSGGLAGDVFAFGPRGGDDVIRDFGAGDRVDLSAFGFDSFGADVRPHLEERGDDMLLDLSDQGLTVLIRGVDPDDLSGRLFLLDTLMS